MNWTKVKQTVFTKKFIIELFIMTFGMLITAVAVHFFLVPSKLIIGSISGLSIVLSELTPLSVSTVSFMINSVLLILAYILIGKEFGLKTVYTALMLSPWLALLEALFPNPESLMQDAWFDLVCFVVVLSAAQAILFKINASTGGLDILAKIVNKYAHVNIGSSVTVAGGLICLTAILINPPRMVIIGLIGTWVNGLVLNHFSAGLNSKQRVCIISKEYERIKSFILNDIGRGVTLYEVIGGYSGEKTYEIEVLLNKDEFDTLMKFINNNMIDSFITSGSVSEVYGLWNKQKRSDIRLKKKSTQMIEENSERKE